MENGKKYETISLDLSKFEIDSKDISEKVLQEIIKKIGEENLKLKEITQNYEAYKGNKKEQKNKIKKLEKDVKKIEQNSIPKDKIREKIEELEKQEDWYIENKSLDDLYGKIDILKELLEENE